MTDDIELRTTIDTPTLKGTVSFSSIYGSIVPTAVCGFINPTVSGYNVYVPYVGCLRNVDLGDFNLSTTGYLAGILANGVTATTQIAGDNSTKVATTAYVDNLDIQTFWDKDGTVLSPHTDGDDVSTTGNITGLNLSGILTDGVTATTQTALDNSTKVATTAYVDSLDIQTYWDRDGTVLSPHTDGDDVYVDGAIEATGTGTFGGTSSGQSVIASGLVVNEDGGNTAVDDFRVETISHSDAFKINASTDIAEFNVNVSINADLTATTIDGSLIDGVTAVTQADKDNSTKVATTAYVDTKVDKYEEFEMTSTEISDKYITIIGIINNNQSIRLFLDNIGIKAEQGIDYSVSGNQIFWTGYNLEQSLEAGDKLKIFYI